MQLRTAANALGVHYQTAYGWVRQGALEARKTPRGYEVSEADVRALAARRAAGTGPKPEVRVREWGAQLARLQVALAAGDEAQAQRDFARLAGLPLAELCDQLIGPALRQLGERWAAGELSIGAEHRATAICERLIAARAHQPQGRPRGVAVVTTPPGERHGLPALMATVCLREDRWLVHHLAADLPAAEVARMAVEVGANLVVLSACTADAAGAARQAADEIKAAAPGRHVLAGQPGDTLTQLRRLARAVADSSLRSVTSALAAWFAPGRGLGVGAGRC